MQTTPVKSLLALAIAAMAATSAQAVSFTQGDVTMDINGTVNGFFINRDNKVTDVSGAQTTTKSSGISNGLLPGWINFVATAKAGDMDVKAHISFAPGINDNSTTVGLPGPGSAFSQIDTRNNYFSFGNANMGTFKIGRDIGMFGQNAILNDMTLLGVGGTTGAAIPFNTTFGMIGHGYMYTGFQAQISYTSPKVNGLQAGAGIFQPKVTAGGANKSPAVQAMATYDVAGSQIWAGLVEQKVEQSNVTTSYTANAFELGAKTNVAGFDLSAYGFQGKGIGASTIGAIGLLGADATGNRTDSRGYFLQATYKVGATKFGVNYGENKDKGSVVDGIFGAGSEAKNKGVTFGVYHSLNKFVTLVGEINSEDKTNGLAETTSTTTAAKVKNNSISLGGILFF